MNSEDGIIVTSVVLSFGIDTFSEYKNCCFDRVNSFRVLSLKRDLQLPERVDECTKIRPVSRALFTVVRKSVMKCYSFKACVSHGFFKPLNLSGTYAE